MFGLRRLWSFFSVRLSRLVGRVGRRFSRRHEERGRPSSGHGAAEAAEGLVSAEPHLRRPDPGTQPGLSPPESTLEDQLRQVPPPEPVARGEEWPAWAAELAERIAGREEPQQVPFADASQRRLLVWIPWRLATVAAAGLLVVLGWGLWQLGLRPPGHEGLPGPSPVASSPHRLFRDDLSGMPQSRRETHLPWNGQVIPLPEASPEPFLAVSIAGNGGVPGRSAPEEGSWRWALSAGRRTVVHMRPWTSTRAWWRAVRQGSLRGRKDDTPWDFLAAVVAQGGSPGGASWLPWSTAAWNDQPRIWYEVGSDPREPNARWLLLMVQCPALAPRDDRPRELIVVVAPSERFRHSYSFSALSEELVRMAARARPADRLLVLGNGGELQLPLVRLVRQGTAREQLRRLRSQGPEQLRRALQEATGLIRRNVAAAGPRRCCLVIVTDLPWWTTSAGEVLAWARRWGEPLRGSGRVALVRPCGPSPRGDGWPLVAALWRVRQFRWRHAEHLRRLLWEASDGAFGRPVRLGVEVEWFGEAVGWVELPCRGWELRAGGPPGLEGVPPGGLMAAMIRFGVSASGGEADAGSGRLLGWVRVSWQSAGHPVRSLRRPLGVPEPRAFHDTSPLFRAAWLGVHAGQRRLVLPGGAAGRWWHELAAPGAPPRWRRLVRLVETAGGFD